MRNMITITVPRHRPNGNEENHKAHNCECAACEAAAAKEAAAPAKKVKHRAPEGFHPAAIIYTSDNPEAEDFAIVKPSKYLREDDNLTTIMMFALAKEYAKNFGEGTLKEAQEYMTALLMMPLEKAMRELEKICTGKVKH